MTSSAKRKERQGGFTLTLTLTLTLSFGVKIRCLTDLVPGPETLYIVPCASAAAVPTVLVAAAVASDLARLTPLTPPIQEGVVFRRVLAIARAVYSARRIRRIIVLLARFHVVA